MIYLKTLAGYVKDGKNINLAGFQENQAKSKKDLFIYIYNSKSINRNIWENKIKIGNITIKE